MRYVLPVLGFGCVFMGAAAHLLANKHRLRSSYSRSRHLPLRLPFRALYASGFRFALAASLLAAVASTVNAYPHQLAYFNELAGGPSNGWRHLLHSNFDAHQDLLYAAQWQRTERAVSQTFYWLGCPYDPRDIGIRGVGLDDVNWCDLLARNVRKRTSVNVIFSKQVLVEQADSFGRFELQDRRYWRDTRRRTCD